MKFTVVLPRVKGLGWLSNLADMLESLISEEEFGECLFCQLKFVNCRAVKQMR